MNDPIIQKAQEDLAEVTKDIQRFKKDLEGLCLKQSKLSAFLDIYGANPSDSALNRGAVIIEPPGKGKWSAGSNHRNVSEETAKSRIANHVAELLGSGARIRTRDLLSFLAEEGLVPGGADKIQALSAILSKDDRFVPDRANGWSLKK